MVPLPNIATTLLAYDGSPASVRAFDQALAWAAARKGVIMGAIVIQPGEAGISPAAQAELAEDFDEQISGLAGVAMLESGPLEQTLRTLINREQSDLVILGTNGRRHGGRKGVGSLTAHLLKDPPATPILVVPADLPEGGLLQPRPGGATAAAVVCGDATDLLVCSFALSAVQPFGGKVLLLPVGPSGAEAIGRLREALAQVAGSASPSLQVAAPSADVRGALAAALAQGAGLVSVRSDAADLAALEATLAHGGISVLRVPTKSVDLATVVPYVAMRTRWER